MNKINTGGTAFPTVDEHRQNYGEQGMTLRQYYAAKAMQGIITANSTSALDYEETVVARRAFAMADALINFEEQGK